MASRKLFVTVGTTKFDSLIREISSPDALKSIASLGYSDIVLQIGRGDFEPVGLEDTNDGPRVSCFRLKDSIADDIEQADLVVSHAGAGSIMDSLGAGKAVLVVINEQLMGNHQTELAEKLAAEGYLQYCNVSNLLKCLQSFNFKTLKPFPKGNPSKFVDHLDRIMGFL